jgi:hypothetical protein
MKTSNAILQEALYEIAQENHKKAVQREVQRLRAQMNASWHVRLFPWRLKIVNVLDNK